MKPFVVSDGAAQSDNLTQVMSLESASLVAVDTSENNKNLKPSPHLDLRLMLEATLALTSITHQNPKPNCWRSSCIAGNVGTRF